MKNYPEQEGTATISIDRFKELEEKEQALEANQIMIIDQSCGVYIQYYNKEDAISYITQKLEESNANLCKERTTIAEENRTDKFEINVLKRKIRDTKTEKPSLWDRICWDFKNTPLADV